MHKPLLPIVALLCLQPVLGCSYDPVKGNAAVDGGQDDAATQDAQADSGQDDSGQDGSSLDDDAGDSDAQVIPGDCDDAPTLPRYIDVDTVVGPGCVRIEDTELIDDATFTVLPGTRVRMATGGTLHTNTLIAVGTEQAPITFTSDAASPAAGDWSCVYFGGDGTLSNVQHVTFEHGGHECSINGRREHGMLQVNGPAHAVSHNVFRHSLSHGMTILYDASVRASVGNHFEANGDASIHVTAQQLLTLGSDHTFVDSDDYIDVEAGAGSVRTGTLQPQPVPFRSDGTLDVSASGGILTIAAGVQIEFVSGSLKIVNGALHVEGTESSPVLFTSASDTPQKGDWGCITYVSGTARFDHAIVEYGGNASACGAPGNTALNMRNDTPITHSVFRHVAGTAIRSTVACDSAAWCMNTFEDVDSGPLLCSGDLIACP